MNNNYIQGFNINWDLINNDSYLKNIKSINSINEFVFDKPLTFFTGENGSGKTTLLQAIAEGYGFNSEGGTKNYNFSTYSKGSDLTNAITIYKGFNKPDYNYYFKAESFYNVATKELEYIDSFHPSEKYHEESHGESFLHLFNIISNVKGIYILDEPEAAISLNKQLTLFSLIYEAIEKGSQFIIATHSPILLAIPNANIYKFTEDGIDLCSYEDTDSYQIMKSFINHKDIMIKELINK